MRRLFTGTARLNAAPFLLFTIVMLDTVACGPPFVLPSLEHQKQSIVGGEIKLHALNSKAFLETWGQPTYAYSVKTQFFPLANGNYIPRFRVPTGEPPSGWDSTTVLEDAMFLAYADRGELLGFIDNRLVYRERLSAEQIMAIVKQWKSEDMSRTGLEKSLLTPQ
ncbi:MAG: hypothetical protein HZA21_04790 [Nitrospirae bacterium]|nr:hypothetical protein [Nitrospirota bacterium]